MSTPESTPIAPKKTRKFKSIVVVRVVLLTIVGFLIFLSVKPKSAVSDPPAPQTTSAPAAPAAAPTPAPQAQTPTSGAAAPAPATSSDASPAPSSGDSSDASGSSTPDPSPVLSQITLTPGTVASGDTFMVRVDINIPAPAGGASVDITVDGKAQTPLLIPEGDDYYQTPYTAGDAVTVTFDATYGGQTAEAKLTVNPAAALSHLEVDPGTVNAGDSFTVRVDLDSPAPSGGASVDMTWNGNAQDPIVVPEGDTWASSTYNAGSLSADNKIDASYNGQNIEVTEETVAPCSVEKENGVEDDSPCIDDDSGETSTAEDYAYKVDSNNQRMREYNNQEIERYSH